VFIAYLKDWATATDLPLVVPAVRTGRYDPHLLPVPGARLFEYGIAMAVLRSAVVRAGGCRRWASRGRSAVVPGLVAEGVGDLVPVLASGALPSGAVAVPLWADPADPLEGGTEREGAAVPDLAGDGVDSGVGVHEEIGGQVDAPRGEVGHR
jgi:hypothetical protein